MATPKAKETEQQRRARHAKRLAAAWTVGDIHYHDAVEVAVRAATYNAIPGKQKRNAAYMLKAREDAVRAACRALRRAK